MSRGTLSRHAWLTLSGVVPPPRRVCLTIPGGAEWLAELRGAALLLTKDYNFELDGDLTPSEMAEAWLSAFDTLVRGWCYADRICFPLCWITVA